MAHVQIAVRVWLYLFVIIGSVFSELVRSDALSESSTQGSHGSKKALPEEVVFAQSGDGDYHLKIASKAVGKLLVPKIQPVSRPMSQWAGTLGLSALINGGYFHGDKPVSLVVINGERQADNIAAVTRHARSFPVLRSAFWVNSDGRVSIDWVGVDRDNRLLAFAEPLHYRRDQLEPLIPPANGSGSQIDPLWAVGGGPRLLQDGMSFITYDEEVFWGSGVKLDDVRPRTAICITESADVLLYVTRGARLDSLPRKLRALGCRDAMNLDGGGSSAMYVEGRAILDQQRAVPVVLAIRAAD